MLEVAPFQADGVNLLRTRKRFIIGDEAGVGKTCQAIRAMMQVAPRNCIIFAPKNAMYVWKMEEMRKWGDQALSDKFVIIRGTPAKRAKLWASSKFVICTVQTAIKDAHLVNKFWELIIVDEAHKGARNRKTKSWKLLKALYSPFYWMLTGSPASKGPQDIWGMLNIIDPARFTSYWKFVGTFCETEHNGFGMEIIGAKNTDQLKAYIAHAFIRRTKKEVWPQLPPKLRQSVPLEMEDDQREIYNQVANDMMLIIERAKQHFGDTDDADSEGPDWVLDDEDMGEQPANEEEHPTDPRIIIASDVLAQITLLRKILICPKLVDASYPWGVTLDYIAESIEESVDKHVGIICPFTTAFPYVKSRLALAGIPDDMIFVLKGGTKLEAIAQVIEEWRRKRGVMLLSAKFAEAFTLNTAKTVYMLGYDFDPEVNTQAEDRFHRANNEHVTNVYYPLVADSYDQRAFEILDNKTFATAFLRTKFIVKMMPTLLGRQS